jgi:hypothetical protein
MEQLDQIAKIISVTMGAAWASGINLYAAILVLGVLGITDSIVLPASLQILMNPLVIGAAGVMYLVEFFADKIPGVDTGWDSVHRNFSPTRYQELTPAGIVFIRLSAFLPEHFWPLAQWLT